MRVSPHRWRCRFAIVQLAILAAVAAAHAAPPAAEAPFLAENQAAMDTMMAGMDVKPSGDVDYDFAAMMIPHHQGAIDMAQAELRYGHNEQLRRIAQEIIVEQQQEIAAMRLALGQRLPAAVASPDQASDLTVGVARAAAQETRQAAGMPAMDMPMMTLQKRNSP
jgi:replicative superfamily II helicase